MLRRRLVPLLLVLALVGTAAACGGDDGDSGEASASSSSTIRTGKASEADLARLLTTEDLEAAGFPGTTAADVSNAPVQQNSDPRGPCGGKVSKPPLEDAFGRTFSSSNRVVIELVTPAGGTQTKYIEELRRDVKPDCASYQSKSAAGGDQTVSDIQVLPLGDLGVPAIGWTQKISAGAQDVSGVVLAIVAGGKLAFVQAVSTAELAPDSAMKLVTATLQRLKG